MRKALIDYEIPIRVKRSRSLGCVHPRWDQWRRPLEKFSTAVPGGFLRPQRSDDGVSASKAQTLPLLQLVWGRTLRGIITKLESDATGGRSGPKAGAGSRGMSRSREPAAMMDTAARYYVCFWRKS